MSLYPFVGRDFFPTVDAGQLRLHVRCPPGTRIESTEVYFQRVEDYIRQVIPAAELDVINDNIGLPNNINLALGDSVTVGPSDGEILVALRARHHPTAGYLETLRAQLPRLDADLSLAATTQAFQDATIYARTSGYLSRRLVDIGDRVGRGRVTGGNRLARG